MVYVNALVILIYFLLVLNATLAVMLDNRQPVKTIAWILIIFLVPIIGLLLYYFFGQNIRRERIFNKKSVDLLTQKVMAKFVKQEFTEVPEPVLPLIQYFKRNSLALPFGSNEAELYTRGGQFVDALIKDIDEARHHVHLDFFKIEDDSVGRRVREALLRAVGRGVVVRVIYDDVGCWTVPKRFFREMSHNGIFVQAFLPVHFRSLSHRVNYRNHRKLAVIDGRTGYIGGMNLAERYVKGEKGRSWLDLHMRVTGLAVYGIQQLFLTDWYFCSQELITDQRYYPTMNLEPARTVEGQTEKLPGGALMQIVSTAPFARWQTIQMGYNRIILNAKRYIFIQTPYFMPPESILESLQNAALSGVRVQLMVPLKPGGFWMTWANESYFGDVLKAGIEVYAYRPGMLHAKMLVVDDYFASVGSANMDFRSLGQTFEDSAFIYDTPLSMRIKALFEEARRDCIKIDLEMWNNRTIRRRIIESFVKIFSPLF